MATARKAPAKKTAAPAKKAAQTARGRAQDRKLIAGGQKYEVSYEANHDKTTVAAVKEALKQAGHSRIKVRRVLNGGK